MDVSDRLALVVSELVTNVVLHSGSPDVSVRLTFDGVGVTVEVVDTGMWLIRGARRQVEGATFGRGLDLVAACTSWWAAIPTAAGTKVVARLLAP